MKYDELPLLKDENLILRPITNNDTKLVVKWRNSPDVKQNFIFQDDVTEEIHTEWLNTKVYTGKVIQYIIEYDNLPIGSVYFRDIDYINNCAEFGIFIGEKQNRGKGIGFKVTKMFTKFGHEELHLHRINLRLLITNIQAYKSYKKAGYCFEGIFADMVKIKDHYEDIMFMSSIAN